MTIKAEDDGSNRFTIASFRKVTDIDGRRRRGLFKSSGVGD